VLSFADVTKSVNGVPLYENISFQLNPGEKVGLVGPNGIGKTTLFNLIMGFDKVDAGQVSLHNNLKLSYFSQKVGEMRGRSALHEVISGNEILSKLGVKLKEYEDKLADPDLSPEEMDKVLEKMGDCQVAFEKEGGYQLETLAEEILTGLGIPPAKHHNPVEDFSGGWKMRIALAKVLITNPDLILMDEPTNYLDMETILWLEKWLKNFKGSIFMTSHDREFMNNVVTKVVELSPRGMMVFTGNLDFYEEQRKVLKKQNEAEFDRQQAMLKKEEEFIARFKARASHAAQVQSRVKKIDKIDRVELEQEMEQVSILLPNIPRGGNDVVLIDNLSKSWKNSKGEEQLVFSGLTTGVSRQEKIAIVGVNGAGKSTLMKIIAGKTDASSGSVKIGPSIQIGYFGQFSFENVNMENTVFEEVRNHLPHVTDAFVRSLLAAFLFKGDDVFKKIKFLSGGEKSRVILSWLLSNPFNLLILDEPTNHLDIASREVLLDALKRYEGTILFVSHDRHFLKELSTKVMEVDKGKVYLHPGNYQSYLELRSPSK
jgi:ATP-binding cassette, subfamily F, member 3